MTSTPTEPHQGMLYTEFVSKLCTLREARLYLEVGVQNGINLSQIVVETAVGVDPQLNLTENVMKGKQSAHLCQMSSDAFFASQQSEIILAGKVDIAFLDGMHLFEYLLRDFYNTERRMSKNGLIALHDCLPFNAEMIERVFDYDKRSPGPHRGAWTGDVWKLTPILQEYRQDLEVLLVDCFPTGLVVISNLDPLNTALSDNYVEIVKKWREVPNNAEELEAFYAKQTIIEASKILDDHSHSAYFKL